MTTLSWRCWYWNLGLVSSLAIGGMIAVFGDRVLAQITPDGTLGAESSVVTPSINDLPTERIDGGATRGANLFHSFREFNISEGRGAYFTSPDGITNILSRVTGGNPSNILGTVGVRGGSANLFLINPNGIVFGPASSLDVGGSFVATTANAIGFAEQGFFSASAPDVLPVLTVNPSAFLFNQIAHGAIANSSTAPAGLSASGANVFGLRVPDGQSLLLVGGDISIDGGRLNALGGRVELGGLSRLGSLGLEVNSHTFRLSFPPESLLANVTLAHDARVGVRGSGGGDIVVNANAFTATNGGRLVAGSEGQGNGGDITVNAHDFTMFGVGSSGIEAGLYNQVLTNAVGNAGDINVTVGSLSLTNEAQLNVSTFGQGNAGSIFVQADGSVFLKNSNIYSNIESGAVGSGGDINITAGSVSLTDGAQLQSLVRRASETNSGGRGDAGNVNIAARNTVSIAGMNNDGFPSAVFNTVGFEAVGNSGKINIKAGSLTLADGGLVSASAFGQGNAGDINIKTQQLIVRDGAQVDTATFGTGQGGNLAVNASSVELTGTSADGQNRSALISKTEGSGNAGDLTINTERLIVRDGAVVLSSTFGAGRGGNLTVNASDSVALIGTSADGQNRSALGAETQGSGDAKDLTINTRYLRLQDGAIVSVATLSQGQGGNLTVNASDSVALIGTSADGQNRSALSSKTEGSGNAGDLTINTRQLSLWDGAGAIASTFGAGRGGNLTVNASDSVALIGTSADGQNRSALGAETQGSGDAKDLMINTRWLILRDGAIVSTASTLGEGQGGALNVNASESVELTGTSKDGQQHKSTLSTETQRGSRDAKDLTLNTGQLSVRDGALITSSTFGQGRGGDVRIQANSLSLTNGARITSRSEGQGNAGDAIINVRNMLQANNGTVSTTATQSAGGAIDITASDIRLLGNSDIRTNVSSGARGGGNINLTANSIIAFDDSDILAFAQNGRGGDINFNTPAFFGFHYRPVPPGTKPDTLDGNNQVDINASGALAGVITLPDVSFLQNSLTQLPENQIDTNNLVANSCIARSGKQGSFIITGAGGLPIRPGDASISPYPTGIVRSIPNNGTTGDLTGAVSDTGAIRQWKLGEPIIEPQGAYRLSDGQLVLSRECP